MKLSIFIFSILVGSIIAPGEAGELQTAVQDVFREVLGFHPPEGHTVRTTTPPKHMLALYHKYMSGKGKRSTIPSTVRNILPIKGPPSMADLVLFNVSCVDEREEVRLGQLHLNRRRLHQRHFSRRILAPPYRVKVYRVSGNRLSSLGSVPVPQANKAAWHSVDITSPLRELLLDSRASNLLGIRFEAPRGKPLTPKHFLRDTAGSSTSFLVIFSEESSENDVTDDGEILEKEPPIHTHDLAMKIQSLTKGKWIGGRNNFGLVISNISASDNSETDKFMVNNTFSTQIPEKSTQELLMTKRPPVHGQFIGNRLKRSVEDNELPVDPNNSNLVLVKEHNIALPAHKRKGRRGSNSGKRKNKKPRINSESSNILVPEESESPELIGFCRLQKLKVTFADIGWDDWIIAPDTFEANYCTGSCSYPLNKKVEVSNDDVRATNHATLQSLVHFLGKNVPPPSCAPDELSPAGFLFLDESGNTILKKYPNMRVESCSCR